MNENWMLHCADTYTHTLEQASYLFFYYKLLLILCSCVFVCVRVLMCVIPTVDALLSYKD